MTELPGRTLKAMLILFLFPISHCFGTIRYVNISNATPGAGTSWATAFNNLQSALAVASGFDQIWIAQGTYKPSVPAGRSATFSIPGGIAIYGGFNGTETANTQANPALYPTILSGDIGVVGNASDNCYHVVTYNANLWINSCNGVTIRDGQADAGSSSVAQPDNTGGGVVFLSANSGDASGTDFYNCTFINNYAFYGGAIGSFANTALQVNYGATNCLFQGNQAVYGGAVFNTNVATDYLYVFENDIFYNNTASAGGASVFGNTVTNGTTTEFLQMENCLFYNEAAPIFTNDFNNSAFSTKEIDYNIVWTSGTPYTLAYSGGNTPLAMGNSDIDGSFPLGSNIDADPLFVNAAGGDFHVSPCSPVIDQGPTFAETTTDFGGNPRMQGPAVDIGPYETLKGTAATAPSATTPISVCLNSSASDLSGDATGTNLLWYTAATGGTGNATAPTPITTTAGSTTWYVTQTPSGSCESPRTALTVTINSPAVAPTSTAGATYCENATATSLTATGANLLWYTAATGGTGAATAPTPITTTAGSTTWYVTQTPSGSCESTRTPVTVTIASPSTAPTSTAGATYCENATATTLTATGANLLWYTAASGGTGNATAPTPITTTAGSTTWYVTQTPSGSCESPRTAITITIASASAAPTTTAAATYCENTTATQLTASGTNLLWYTAATGGTGDATAPTPITTTAGSTTWYVTQTPSGSCESPRTAITVTIASPAAAPTTTAAATYCENTTATQLTATGANLLWYTAATGGTGNATAPTPITTTAGSTTWYVTQTPSGSCESPRTPVTITIASPAAAPTTAGATYCENTTATQLTATGANLLWYTTASGGTGDATAPTPLTTTAGSTTWYVTQTPSGSCESPRAQITVTVNPIPQLTIDPVNGALCAGSDIKLEARGADSYQWSPETGLSNPLISNPVVTLQNDVLYTVTGTTAGCSATTQVSLTVGTDCMGYYIPNAFSPNGDGNNDVFRVKTGDVPRSFEMMVFNRYGGMVFETADIGSGWNGTIGGNLAPTGAYVYTVVLTTSAGSVVKRQGTVLLVR